MNSLYYQSDHSRQKIGDCLELVAGFGLSINEVAGIKNCSAVALEMWVNEILIFKRKRIKCTYIEVRQSSINT